MTGPRGSSIGVSGTSPDQRDIVTARGITKNFGGIAALAGVDFDLRPGEIHALVGENGAGKSTLMKILAGVHTDYDGTIAVDGAPVHFASVRDAEAAGIAIIHQELNLVPGLSVAENVFLGREPLRFGLVIDRRATARTTRALIGRLGLDLDPEARVGGLRIGEQQLVEIVKALSLNARILIMDEPTSALSPAECARLFKIIRQLSQDGVAIVYISHRIDEVLRIADRVSVLRDGRHVLTDDMANLDESTIIASMVGRSLLDIQQEARGPRPEVVLSVRDLTLDMPHRRGWRRVLDGVSFDLHAGEILGIAGLLGAGRTEILRTIFGAATGRATGEIQLRGHPVSIRSPRDAQRLGLALVTEDRKSEGLHLDASITDNIALPRVAQLSRFGLRGFAGEAGLARHAIAEMGVRCEGPAQRAGTLSGGNQQKVVMGKALATRPAILLLDEPTRGIDVGAKREIYDLIFRLARDGLGILVVSSELPELLLLADRVLVMAEGRATGILPRAAATEQRIMSLAAPRRRSGAAA